MKSKRRFERNINELQSIFNFLKMNFNELNVQGNDQLDMELSVEEIFANMVRHNSKSTHDIEITVESTDREMIVSLSDYEDVPFDITKMEEVNFDDYLKNQRSGGLGIHLVNKVMDNVKFEHQHGVSTITIIKNI